MQNPLMIEQFVARPADVIHDFVAPILLERFAHAAGDIIENFVPGSPLPLAFAALTDAFQWITDTLGIGHLVERCRTFGAVAPATAGVLGIAFEAPNCIGLFFDDGNEPAGRFTIEADRRNDPAMFLDLARPLGGIVFDPVLPFFDRRISRESVRFKSKRIGIQRRAQFTHLCSLRKTYLFVKRSAQRQRLTGLDPEMLV